MLRASFAMILLFASVSTLAARQWTDATGKYHHEAALVEFDGKLVVLKKAEGQLIAMPVEQLSQQDQEFLKSKQAKEDIAAAASKDPTWSLIDGKQFTGRVSKFGEKELVISRKLGELYVNGKPFAGLPALRQYILPRIVGHEEGKDIKSASGIQDLFVASKGANLVYRVKGVVFEIESGENVAVPIWLLSDKDRKVIEPQWNAWAAAGKDVKLRDRIQAEQSTLARAAFNEYQRNRLVEHRLQYFQSAAQWNQPPQPQQQFQFEVGLTHPSGLHTTVTITASNELAARTAAEQQNPHCQVYYSRRVP
jgi:hypothetical protein